MEAMNQSGQPRKSGKRGPMRPAPLTSGGPALEGVTCRGWDPHLQYSFLIKLASLSGKFIAYFMLSPMGLQKFVKNRMCRLEKKVTLNHGDLFSCYSQWNILSLRMRITTCLIMILLRTCPKSLSPEES